MVVGRAVAEPPPTEDNAESGTEVTCLVSVVSAVPVGPGLAVEPPDEPPPCDATIASTTATTTTIAPPASSSRFRRCAARWAARCAAIRDRRSPSCLAPLAFPIVGPRGVTIRTDNFGVYRIAHHADPHGWSEGEPWGPAVGSGAPGGCARARPVGGGWRRLPDCSCGQAGWEAGPHVRCFSNRRAGYRSSGYFLDTRPPPGVISWLYHLVARRN